MWSGTRVWLGAILALVFLTEPVPLALHDHEDHHSHAECGICQLLADLASASPVPPQVLATDASWVLLEPQPPQDPVTDPAPFALRPRSPPSLPATDH